MKKDDNSGVSIKQIIMTAMFLIVTTFGGLNIYRIVYEKDANTIQVIESASAENFEFESALVENTEDDIVYSKRVEYLGSKVIDEIETLESLTSRGNYIREKTTDEEVEIINDEDNKLLNVVLNGIKEIGEKQEAIINNDGVSEIVEIFSGDSQSNTNDNEESDTFETDIEQTEDVETIENTVTSQPTGVPTEYVKTIDVKATAYCLCKKCCGKSPSNPNYGVTASGLKIIPGTGMKVVASDPSVIPLGTEVYIEGLYGAKDYGYAIVADTGSAIKNLKIDLYMDTHQMALNWGVKTVRVYILDK